MSEVYHNGFFNVKTDISDEKIERLKSEWQKYTKNKTKFLGQKIGKGRGIVITSGGLRYFTTAWILIKTLRELGCKLPIEVWHYGNEITDNMKLQLASLETKCKDLAHFIDECPHGFLMKPLSILYSSFKEVLFLDADNMCVKNPSYLFEDKNYKKYGCLFWPDYWETAKSNPIWSILDISYFKSYEQDSGQMLIDKSRSWAQLQLCVHLNAKGDEYYKFLYGDKDTFRFSWLALKKEYFMIEHAVGTCGYINKEDNSFNGVTMVQRDREGEIIFLHRNLLKWDITNKDERVWQLIKFFSSNAQYKHCYFKRTAGKHNAIDLEGDIDKIFFDNLFPDFERRCLKFLNELRSSSFYNQELVNWYLSVNRS
jgi:alpha 1,2-mannosyltransferase